MASNKCMVVAAVFVVAFAVVKANQCSAGGEGPGNNKPNNVVSMLQTKLQMSAADKADLTADEALLKHVIEQWSVEPLQLVDRSPSSFRQRHQCQKESLLATTFRSLDANTGGSFNFSDIPNLLKQNMGVVKFSIRGGQVVFDANFQSELDHHPCRGCETWYKQKRARGELLHAQLKALLNEVDLPDMELLVSVTDGSPQNQVGIMRTEGCVGKDLLMIPRSLLQLDTSDAQQPVCSQHYPQAVFRGNNNGPPQSNMRTFAAKLSNSRPDLLDAGFSDFLAVPGWSRADLKKQNLMKGFLKNEEQQCYSAGLVIDGYSVPDRLPQQLLWGLPTVFMHDMSDDNMADEKNHCTIDEFWYPELTPDVDFIKATPDNLETILESLLRDPKRRARIGQSGKKYVQKHLSLNRLKCYLHQLLSDYGARYAMR